MSESARRQATADDFWATGTSYRHKMLTTELEGLGRKLNASQEVCTLKVRKLR